MFPTRRITTSGGDKFRDEFSLAFDGTSDVIKIPERTYDVDGATYTFVFWVKRAVLDEQLMVLGHTGASNIDCIQFDANNKVKIESTTNGDWAVGTQHTNDTNWHHYVVSVSSGTVTMWQDGIPLSISGNVNGNNLKVDCIGGSGTNGAIYEWNGNMSEVAIYNAVFSHSHAKTVYNGGEPFNHNDWKYTKNLTSWWRMGDDQGSLSITNGDTIAGGTGAIADQTNKKRAVIKEWDFSSDEDGWLDYGGNSVSQSTAITNHLGGTGVIKCENNDLTDVYMGRTGAINDSNVGIEAGKLYLIEYYIYVPSSWSGTCEFRCQEASMNGKTYAVDVLRPTSATKDSWQYGKNIFSPVSTDLTGYLYPQTISGSSLVADDFVYLSGVKLTEYESTNHGCMANFPLGSIEGDTP